MSHPYTTTRECPLCGAEVEWTFWIGRPERSTGIAQPYVDDVQMPPCPCGEPELSAAAMLAMAERKLDSLIEDARYEH